MNCWNIVNKGNCLSHQTFASFKSIHNTCNIIPFMPYHNLKIYERQNTERGSASKPAVFYSAHHTWVPASSARVQWSHHPCNRAPCSHPGLCRPTLPVHGHLCPRQIMRIWCDILVLRTFVFNMVLNIFKWIQLSRGMKLHISFVK